MCHHQQCHNPERRGFLQSLAASAIGLLALLIRVKPSKAEEVCGAKCISLPYDGGTCVKVGRHQFHRCSEGHSW
jgi:hypothetical protein